VNCTVGYCDRVLTEDTMPHSDEPRAPRSAAFGPIVIEFDELVLEPRAWTFEQSAWLAELAATAAPGPIHPSWSSPI
jgi:hypothetical protein